MKSEPANLPAGQQPRRTRSLSAELITAGQLPGSFHRWLREVDLDQLLLKSPLIQAKDRCVVARLPYEDRVLLLKRHIWGGAYRTATKCLRMPAAKKCWHVGRQLQAAGVATPSPWAYVGRFTAMFNTRSYLLTEFIDGESLYRVLRYRDLSPRQMRSLARQVAAIWQQLANLGASHNDLKPENLMVDRSERVWLIDLEMVHWHRRRRELEARHLLDATRFFHARSWRRQPAARELFLEALLAVPLGRRLLDIAPGGHVLRHHRLSRHELESGLSVVVRCGDRFGGSLPRRSLDSVLDFADEVLLAYPAEESGRRLYRLSGDCQSLECLAPGTSPAQPWVLRLVEDDCLPADTGKEIQERIADRAAADYYRADIEQIDPLHPLASRTRRRTPEIRLLHRERCRYNAVDDRFEHESLRGGVLRFSLTSTGSGSSELAQPKPRPGLRSAA